MAELNKIQSSGSDPELEVHKTIVPLKKAKVFTFPTYFSNNKLFNCNCSTLFFLTQFKLVLGISHFGGLFFYIFVLFHYMF